MAVFNTLTFENENSMDYGVYISGEAVYNAPERSIEMVPVPGRNGAIAIDQGYFENIEVLYPAGIFADNEADFAQSISEFRNFLCSKKGYCKLVDDYNPDEYRMAIYKSGLQVTPFMLKAGEFEIAFECKPQRWLISGETALDVTSDGSILNPTQFPSRPLIKVTGTGTLTIGDVEITLTVSPTTIDCESMEAYNGSTNRNGTISLSPNKFPELEPGTNTITKTSGITKIEIIPRWWRL